MIVLYDSILGSIAKGISLTENGAKADPTGLMCHHICMYSNSQSLHVPAEGGILHDQQEQHHRLQKLCKGAKINDIVLFVNVTYHLKNTFYYKKRNS